eukprot:195155-Prorocentrum_lima.AAC.1
MCKWCARQTSQGVSPVPVVALPSAALLDDSYIGPFQLAQEAQQSSELAQWQQAKHEEDALLILL